ncbi:LysR family transcriptional regulator [Bacteriovorax sp. Seq25_V]|uniref:LysR family transcriptional regulator n=1 Tax=Bacteriovorax sp. Seq25_V TaxID=1201288 RepID=UPI000389DE63|nr:LysR family transcriptional regulator [Bacteriovorax sp. Seq25_V]EQC47344.1 transcriptional regulator, LysR family [Bacteriovorax sp. Seq25_V]
MNIANIDLNLLVIFKAIYEKRNISKVAIDLGLSQPTISHALNRLRDTFEDELFIRSGRSMIPTSKASSLGPFVSKQLIALEQGLFSNHDWDAKKSKKKFILSGTAYDVNVCFPKLIKDIKHEAPGMRFEFKGIVYEEFLKRMSNGEVDLSFAANLDQIPNFTIMELARRDLVLIAKKGSRRYSKKVSIESYLESDHIVYAPTEKPGSPIDTMLKGMGKRRKIAISTSYLSSIPLIVCENDCLAYVPDFFAEQMKNYFPIKIIDGPIEVPKFNHQMIWHNSQESSVEHQWLRERFLKIYKKIK